MNAGMICPHDSRPCPFGGCSTQLCARHEFVPVAFNESKRGGKPVMFAGGRGMEAEPCGRDTAISRARGPGSLRPLSIPVTASSAAGTTDAEGRETSPMPNRRRPAVRGAQL